MINPENGTFNGRNFFYYNLITGNQNLTMRMNMWSFTRLTYAFSKKLENLAYVLALHFMYYNFCRIH